MPQACRPSQQRRQGIPSVALRRTVASSVSRRIEVPRKPAWLRLSGSFRRGGLAVGAADHAAGAGPRGFARGRTPPRRGGYARDGRGLGLQHLQGAECPEQLGLRRGAVAQQRVERARLAGVADHRTAEVGLGSISLVASSIVMIRSSAGWPLSQACCEPSWCSIMPRIGRRGRLRRWTPRLGAGATVPVFCR